VLNRVLFHEYGFRGNVERYTDPLNSFLDEVLSRRKGLPITLSILYVLVAQRIGLILEPVGLPGHFVAGCFSEDDPFFIDAFDQGALRTPAELLANNLRPRPDLRPRSALPLLPESFPPLRNRARGTPGTAVHQSCGGIRIHPGAPRFIARMYRTLLFSLNADC
jgi:hypothetical protein